MDLSSHIDNSHFDSNINDRICQMIKKLDDVHNKLSIVEVSIKSLQQEFSTFKKDITDGMVDILSDVKELDTKIGKEQKDIDTISKDVHELWVLTQNTNTKISHLNSNKDVGLDLIRAANMSIRNHTPIPFSKTAYISNI